VQWTFRLTDQLLNTSMYTLPGRSEWPRGVRVAAHQLRQGKHQDMKQKKQYLTSASWLRQVCGGFHNLIRFNCAPFFASCRRHCVLTVTCLDACRCAVYLKHELSSLARTLGSWVRIKLKAWKFVCFYSVFVLFRVGSGLAMG
jgi:hypothetical protein